MSSTEIVDEIARILGILLLIIWLILRIGAKIIDYFFRIAKSVFVH